MLKATKTLAPLLGVFLVVLALMLLPVAVPRAIAADAHVLITATQTTSSGVTRTLAAADAAGNKFANDGRVWLDIANGYSTTITVTVASPQALTKTVAIAAGSGKLIGPFRPYVYNQTGDDEGRVFVDYSQITSVTLAAFKPASNQN